MKEKRQLDDQRKRITKQLDEETEYDRQRRLAIIQNTLSTYKRAINADVTYKSLRPFNIMHSQSDCSFSRRTGVQTG